MDFGKSLSQPVQQRVQPGCPPRGLKIAVRKIMEFYFLEALQFNPKRLLPPFPRPSLLNKNGVTRISWDSKYHLMFFGFFWNPTPFVTDFKITKQKILGRSRKWQIWLVVSTQIEKYARQIGSFPQIGVKIKDVWNHHLAHIRPIIPPTPSKSQTSSARLRRRVSKTLSSYPVSPWKLRRKSGVNGNSTEFITDFQKLTCFFYPYRQKMSLKRNIIVYSRF